MLSIRKYFGDEVSCRNPVLGSMKNAVGSGGVVFAALTFNLEVEENVWKWL